MASNNIMFRIGSAFEGEGFKKAQNAVKDMNGNVKKGMETASQMASAIGGMDMAAGRAVTAMSGMVTTLLTFNATAIVTQGAMLAINWFLNDLKDKADAAKKKADELKASVEAAFTRELKASMAEVNAQVKEIEGDFDRVTKQATAFTSALEGVRGSVVTGGIINLELEKVNAMLSAHSEAERQTIESTYALKIAVQKSADTEAAWNAKIAEVHDAIETNGKRVALYDQEIAAIGEKRKELEAVMLSAKESGSEKWRAIQEQINTLGEKEAELMAKKNEAEAAGEVLALQEQKTKQDALNAQAQATIAIRNAELAETKLTETKHAREVKEAAAKDAAELKASADLIDAQETKSAAQLQAEANKSAKDLATAQAEYVKKLNEFNSFDLIAAAARAQGNAGKSGLGKAGLLPVDVQKGIQMTVADQKVDDAIRNGTINTVKDADRLQRQTMRETRNAISKNQGQLIREQARYRRLQKMNPDALCSSDKAFMEKYKKILDASEKRKKDLENAKKSVDDAKKAQEESAKNLKDIKTQLDKLGLK